MRLLLTRYGLINVDHVVEIRRSWAGLRIELINGESRDIKLPKGVNVNRFLEELGLQMIRSHIVDLESLIKLVCGHNSRSATCGHKDPDPVDVDTSRFQDVDTAKDIPRADTARKIYKTCPICGGKVWWCADCLIEMEVPDPEQCTVYRELEMKPAFKEKFAEILGFDCLYCAYLSKVYCKTGETKNIRWEELEVVVE